ncbi:MAG: hypothetical protein N4A68_18825 [Maledivibacter sp.]|nr:hypothetical protein [Maledivibacter sp.]
MNEVRGFENSRVWLTNVGAKSLDISNNEEIRHSETPPFKII